MCVWVCKYLFIYQLIQTKMQIETRTYIYIYIYIYTLVSLSLCVYIYIYVDINQLKKQIPWRPYGEWTQGGKYLHDCQVDNSKNEMGLRCCKMYFTHRPVKYILDHSKPISIILDSNPYPNRSTQTRPPKKSACVARLLQAPAQGSHFGWLVVYMINMDKIWYR